MLAHHAYPKDAPESRALRNAFICSGLLICLMAVLISLDVAVRNDSAAAGVRQAPDIKTAFMQPKPMGSIFPKAHDTRVLVVDQAIAGNLRTTHGL